MLFPLLQVKALGASVLPFGTNPGHEHLLKKDLYKIRTLILFGVPFIMSGYAGVLPNVRQPLLIKKREFELRVIFFSFLRIWNIIILLHCLSALVGSNRHLIKVKKIALDSSAIFFTFLYAWTFAFFFRWSMYLLLGLPL